MSIADELHKLGELHRSGALTDAEFAQAKARVLAGQGRDASPQDDTVRQHLSELMRENELARLDREWQMERERYYISGRNNSGQYMPTKTSGVLFAVVAIFGGGFWTVMAAGMAGKDGPSIFPLIGVVFILFGIGVGIFTFLRANQLEAAQQRYQRRRAMILSGDDDAADPFPTRGATAPSSTDIHDMSEPAPCVSCGKTIPAGRDRCPHCGWSYT